MIWCNAALVLLQQLTVVQREKASPGQCSQLICVNKNTDKTATYNSQNSSTLTSQWKGQATIYPETTSR